ncbi:hypothetical protein HispidOSU_013483, partial [Sigmodon hispidus]
ARETPNVSHIRGARRRDTKTQPQPLQDRTDRQGARRRAGSDTTTQYRAPRQPGTLQEHREGRQRGDRVHALHNPFGKSVQRIGISPPFPGSGRKAKPQGGPDHARATGAPRRIHRTPQRTANI